METSKNDETEVFNKTNGVNKPKLTTGMIPIYYDETDESWKKADESNPNNQWYDYSITAKKYANICTVSDTINSSKAYRTSKTETKIPTEDMTTMFVWIPRYAYSINAGNYRTASTETIAQTNANPNKKIDVTFLVGTTNTGANGVTYAKDYDANSIKKGQATPKIVHPGFTFGNQELTGIWIGKFAVNGKNSLGEYVGNWNTTTVKIVEPDETTHVKILPNSISWRHTTVGEAEYQGMKMGTNGKYYGWDNVNTHLAKNVEWGVASYLSYSQYGEVPDMNAAATYSTTLKEYYDCYTGAGPVAEGSGIVYDTYTYPTNGYHTKLGKIASTTRNIYGVYDMSGGAWEWVAGYLDNKNSSLNTYGNSTSNTNVRYFENGELKSEYIPYWDKFETSAEEKNGVALATITTSDGNKTQAELWVANATSIKWNDTRKRLTEATFDNMKNNKGTGIYEILEEPSFYGVRHNTNTNKYEFEDTDVTEETASGGKGWNNDYSLIGHINYVFAARGGECRDKNQGALHSLISDSGAYYNFSSRVVLLP